MPHNLVQHNIKLRIDQFDRENLDPIHQDTIDFLASKITPVDSKVGKYFFLNAQVANQILERQDVPNDQKNKIVNLWRTFESKNFREHGCEDFVMQFFL